MLERVWRKGNPPTLLVGMLVGAATVEKLQPRKLKTELPYDPAITLLGMYPDKTLIQRVHMSIAALFTIAKTWKQPKCPLTDEWIKKMWYIHTMENYSAIKKNKIMPFAATWMQLEIIILISQKEKDKYHMVSLICGI